MNYDLRDFFAATESLTGFRDPTTGRLRQDVAENLMGAKLANFGPHTTPVQIMKWWAQAEARLRYIQADAMLAARNLGRDKK